MRPFRASSTRAGAAIPLVAILFSGWGTPFGVGPARAEPSAPTDSATAESAALPFDLAETLQRTAVVAAVLERNASLAAAEHAWRVARARVPQARALPDPQVTFTTAPHTWTSDTTHAGHRIGVTQSFPFWGKRFFRERAAMAEATAAEHGFAGARLQLAWAASLLFVDYYLVSRAAELNDEHIQRIRELKVVAEARFAAGRGSLQDPLQADVLLAHLEHRRVVLHSDREDIRGRINSLLHREPHLPLPPPPRTLPRPPSDHPDVELAVLQDRGATARPEVRAALARIEARDAERNHAVRDFLPDFYLMGSYNSMWQNPEHWWAAGIGVSVPLQIGRRRGALAESRAELNRARAEHAAAVDQARLDAHHAQVQLAEAHHVLGFYESRVLPANRAQIAAARSGYESGRNDFQVVIDAQRTLLDDELGFELALASYHQRRADLARALGDLAALTGTGVQP